MKTDEFTFYKETKKNKIWLVETTEKSFGPWLFSFDKKTVFNFWPDYPEKLTKEQIEIFKSEYPEMAELKSA